MDTHHVWGLANWHSWRSGQKHIHYGLKTRIKFATHGLISSLIYLKSGFQTWCRELEMKDQWIPLETPCPGPSNGSNGNHPFILRGRMPGSYTGVDTTKFRGLHTVRFLRHMICLKGCVFRIKARIVMKRSLCQIYAWYHFFFELRWQFYWNVYFFLALIVHHIITRIFWWYTSQWVSMVSL